MKNNNWMRNFEVAEMDMNDVTIRAALVAFKNFLRSEEDTIARMTIEDISNAAREFCEDKSKTEMEKVTVMTMLTTGQFECGINTTFKMPSISTCRIMFGDVMNVFKSNKEKLKLYDASTKSFIQIFE